MPYAINIILTLALCVAPFFIIRWLETRKK
jgi:hypothetical protein